jgi:GNAT superfamily N-acetyltransferase
VEGHPELSAVQELIFLDAATARRLEAGEEFGDVEATRILSRTHPHLDCRVEAIGGGHMCFSGKDSPIGHAHSLGFAGLVTEELIEEVERFYHSRGVMAQVHYCPFADASLGEVLKKRGYGIQEFNTVLARPIFAKEDTKEKLSLPPDVTVRAPRPEEAKTLAGVVDRGFGNGQPAGFAWMLETWAEMPHNLTLLAEVDGKLAGGASGMILPEFKLGAFWGAATLPEFRGRGVQSALLAARLAMARDAGCDLAVTFTLPGTTSSRNAERAGFRVAYTKAVLGKACAQPDSNQEKA